MKIINSQIPIGIDQYLSNNNNNINIPIYNVPLKFFVYRQDMMLLYNLIGVVPTMFRIIRFVNNAYDR